MQEHRHKLQLFTAMMAEYSVDSINNKTFLERNVESGGYFTREDRGMR